jgi:hypothetical protein
MAGTDDEWPILADPKPDGEEWPLQPNNAPGPPTTEPTGSRPSDAVGLITLICLLVIGPVIIVFLPSSYDYLLEMIVIVSFFVILIVVGVGAAIVERFVNRHKATDTEPRRDR